MKSLLHIYAQLDTSPLPKGKATQATIDNVVGIVFSVLGTIAVLMIVIGGIQYITSKGEPGEMAKAKNTIIYALVGLVVCILAYTIVAFVIRNV
ncbi:MAG TPA: pilin [Candidatus Saccharimonadales bacterium]|nr:pilin [Candidatus Saccharimonadales bacterium]